MADRKRLSRERRQRGREEGGKEVERRKNKRVERENRWEIGEKREKR